MTKGPERPAAAGAFRVVMETVNERGIIVNKSKPKVSLLLIISMLLSCLMPAGLSYADETPASTTYAASAGFSDTQGGSAWSYQRFADGVYSDLPYYDTANKRWQQSASSPIYPWVKSGEMHPASNGDAVRKWTSPGKGTIAITGGVRKGDSNGDGVNASIKKNGSALWSALISSTTQVQPVGVDAVAVEPGDGITFEVNKIGSLNNDHTFWNPTIVFTPAPAGPSTYRITAAESVNTRGGSSGGTNHADTNQMMRVPVPSPDPASGTEFWVKARLVNGSPDLVNTRQGYVKVDLGQQYPHDSASQVTLSVYHNVYLAKVVPVTVRGIADNSWSESSITWNNAPQEEGMPLDTKAVRESGWYSFDVTDFVNARLALGETTVSFRLTDDGAQDLNAQFSSTRASANRPYLELTPGVPQAAAVTAQPKAGNIVPGTLITLATATAGAAIYYTVDGSDPAVNGIAYTAPFPMNQAGEVKAIARKTGYRDSAAASFTYTFAQFPVGTIANLPDSFYERPGLENMPRLDYASMRVANVKDFGAIGDGVADDRAAFDRAVDALQAAGGGIVYMPAGRYYFAAPTPPGSTPESRRFWDRTGERALNNIHFVGDGESTVIEFRNPGIHDLQEGQTYHNANGAYAGGRPYGWRLSGTNYSLHGFSTSWNTRMDMRSINGPYNLGLSGEDIQVTSLNIDQGGIGVVFWQGSKRIWAVDNIVRNTGADAIHFANTVDVVAAYNLVENSNDDAIGFVSDAPGANNWPISANNYALNNTIIKTAWGRGISAGGIGHRLENNWIESSLLSGIFTNSLGQGGVSGVPVQDVAIRSNTIIRSDQNNRQDNNHYPSSVYRGSIALNNNATNVAIEHNRIFGNPGNGILFSAWSSALQGSQLAVRGNEIAGSRESAIKINSNAVIDGLEMTGNKLLGNANSALLGGTLTGSQTYSGNLVTQPTIPAKEGFTVVTDEPSFRDAYADIASEASESGWAAKPSANVPAYTVNVKDYGAKGDGSGSDTRAFYEALDAIPQSGGILYVPAGIYRLAPEEGKETYPFTAIRHHLLLSGKSNIHLKGDGAASVLRFTSKDHQGLRLVDMNDAVVSGLQLELEQQPAQRYNRALLDLSGSTGIRVSDVTVRNAAGPGILVDSSTGVALENNRIVHAGTAGIELLASRQVFVEGNRIEASRDSGIHLNKLGTIGREPQYISIKQNRIEGSRDYTGIGIASGTQIEVADNTIQDTHLSGIHLYYSSEAYFADKVKITGNTLLRTNTGRHTYHYGAITVLRSMKGDLEISGNTINTTPLAGIAIDQSTLTKLQLGQNTFTAVGGPHVRQESTTVATFIDLDRLVNIVSMQPSLLEPGNWSRWGIDIELENSSNAPVGGSVRLVAPAAWADTAQPVAFPELPAGAKHTVTIPVPQPPSTESVPVEVRVELPGGVAVPLAASVNFMAAAKASAPPVIDGELGEEWSDAMPFVLNQERQYKRVNAGTVPWGGTDDLSAVGYTKWDQTHLYVAAVVKDNVHKQGAEDGAAWMGDSLQFMVDPGRLNGPGSSGYSELLFALSDTGQLVRWRWAAVSGKPIGELTNSQAGIVRDETTGLTTYELAIPWTELLPGTGQSPPPLIGFSFLVNDDDGPGRHGWLEYMSGIGTGKNPSLFGELLLSEAPQSPAPHPFKLEQLGNLERTSGISASAIVKPAENAGHAGKETVVFQLMKGSVPVSHVAVAKDFMEQEEVTGQFDVADPQTAAYEVHVFVLDRLNAGGTEMPVPLSEKLTIR
ncbi:Polygalacturonase [Paenibacillus sp. UNCCL117]|uniref:glycosyl hydrolase family 28-related protein n=1 Tax=unclassified Paenibacillus TaxID=185978 RepID=UPI000881BC7C|nr:MULTISPECIES: glycosyl hydrolase family 28-related protein [unclassified Paenibacillus]SDD63882.1 Polygalacturonase [Paenibacillus sp. cl123]SFW58432.1 Polygalacturonase [Paenibacillus sp. UNCCL117]